MLRLWPGWLLCAGTAGLFGYMFGVEGPQISRLINGLPLPDGVYWPYQASEMVPGWHAAFAAAPEAATRYLALHAGPDTVFPALLTLSLGFLGFAALFGRARRGVAMLAGLLAITAALPYMLFDFSENSVADSLFSPQALAAPINLNVAERLPGLTLIKFLTLYAAIVFVLALWIWRWRQGRHAAA